jgi:outer membrane protein
MNRALYGRPDYAALNRKKHIMEERVKIAEGKRLPEISVAGEYTTRAGNQTSFKENWNYGVRFNMPLFDGGLIQSEIKKERAELEKVKEEERALKLLINQEVRDAHLHIANALERIGVTEKAIESARKI